MLSYRARGIQLMLMATLALAACASGLPGQSPGRPPGTPLKVVATSTMVGDVAREIGGEFLELTVLLPYGSDPHAYDPTPRDTARVAEADVIFMNGAGFETFLEPMLASAGGQARLVSVSEGIDLRALPPAGAPAGDPDTVEGGVDPHVWTDPNNVMVWVDNITAALADQDPSHSEAYRANADRYRRELKALDAWIQEQIALIPEENRELVTDHDTFGYLADRYGLRLVGAVIPAFSTLADASAQELAGLEEAIRSLGARAVFVGDTVNPNLSRQVAEDTGARLVFVYTGSLSRPGTPGDTYLGYMRYNVQAIRDALQ